MAASRRVALHLVGRNRPVTELAGVVGTPAVPDMRPIHARESAIPNRLGRGPLKHRSLVHRPNGTARSVPCRALLRSRAKRAGSTSFLVSISASQIGGAIPHRTNYRSKGKPPQPPLGLGYRSHVAGRWKSTACGTA